MLKRKMTVGKLLVSVGLLVILTGCTTAMYSSPKKLSKEHEYQFTIETGGFAWSGSAEEHLKKEANEFMKKHGYSSYEIVDRHHNWVPSDWVFTLRFK